MNDAGAVNYSKAMILTTIIPRRDHGYFTVTDMKPQDLRYNGNDEDLLPSVARFTSRLGDGSGDIEEEYLSTVQMVARLKTNPSMLDIGCGVGRFLILGLPRFASAYYALEPDADRFRMCVGEGLHEKHIKILNMTSGEFRREFPAHTFDVIYLSMVLQHVSTHVAANILKDIAALLNPDGVAVVATTHLFEERFCAEALNDGMKQAEFDAYACDFANQTWGIPVRFFSKASFTAALQAASLDVLFWRQFSYIRPEALGHFEQAFSADRSLFQDLGTSQFAIVRAHAPA